MEQNNRTWWKEAVVYQIYPRSFQDSDGDGIGDLCGITSRLDYIQKPGCGCDLAEPDLMLSPNDDNGYDISDYRAIMREFGTMEDFDPPTSGRCMPGDLRLVLDLVVNHTSDEHPWFRGSPQVADRIPYYTYYHWWPAEQGELLPCASSYFDEEGDAWTYNDAHTRAWYYLHYFSRKQPDLKLGEPGGDAKRCIDMMRFWFDKGIDGFRMDSISFDRSKIPAFPPHRFRKKYPDLLFFLCTWSLACTSILHEMNRRGIEQIRYV